MGIARRLPATGSTRLSLGLDSATRASELLSLLQMVGGVLSKSRADVKSSGLTEFAKPAQPTPEHRITTQGVAPTSVGLETASSVMVLAVRVLAIFDQLQPRETASPQDVKLASLQQPRESASPPAQSVRCLTLDRTDTAHLEAFEHLLMD